MKKANEVLTEFQISMIKRVLGIIEVAETEQTRKQQKLHLMKWFDYSLDYLVRAEVDGNHYKMVYIDTVDESNFFEVKK